MKNKNINKYRKIKIRINFYFSIFIFTLIIFSSFASKVSAATITSVATGNFSATAWPNTVRTGTITTLSTSTAVTGTGTLFTTELNVGNILKTTANVAICTVSVITDNTHLTCVANAATSNTNISYNFQGVGPVDTAVLAVGFTVTEDVANATIAALTLNGGATAAVLTYSTTNSLTVTGAITVNAPTGAVSNSLTINTGILIAGSISLTAGTSTKVSQITLTTGTLTVNGALTIAGTIASDKITVTGAAHINLNGSVVGTGATVSMGTTSILTTSGTSSWGYATTWGTCSITGGTMTFSAAQTCGGVTITNSATLTVNALLTNTANFSCLGFVTGTNAITNNGASAQISSTGTCAISMTGTFTISGATAPQITSGSTYTVNSLTISGPTTNNGTLLDIATTLAGASTLTNGTNATLNFGGSSITPTIVATAAGNKVNYDGIAQTIKLTTYVNLTLSGTGAKTFPTGATTVNGILSIENGTNVNVFTGTITYGTNATLQYNTTVARTASTEWLSPFAATGGVIIAGTGTITANAAKIFNASIPLTIQIGSSLAMSTFLFTLNGNLINNGGTTTGTGGVTITGTATQSIGSFANNGTISMTKTGAVATLIGNVTGGALTINGSGGTLNLGSGMNHTFNGNVTLTAGTLNGGSSLINVDSVSSTAWGGNGSLFTAGTGTVEFGGAGNQTHSASATTFYNLNISGSGAKTLTNISSITGAFTLSGTANATTVANLIVSGLTTINSGATLTQGLTYNFTTGGLTVNSTGSFINIGTGDLLLSGDVSSAGNITINSSGGATCNGDADTIIITSTNTTNRSWSGTGFNIEDVTMSYQTANANITLTSSTDAGHNINGLGLWNWYNCVVTLPISGTLTSSVFDTTAISTSIGFNSIMWKGFLGGVGLNEGKVLFQLGASSTPSGTWNYYGGSTCGALDWFDTGGPNIPIELKGSSCISNWGNKRYFRYKVKICSNDCITAGSNTPTINDIVVNWSS